LPWDRNFRTGAVQPDGAIATGRFPPTEALIGTNTVVSMQSGLYYGMIGMIDGIVERIAQQLGPDTKTVATGGQAELIIAGSKFLTHAEPDLTLEGLHLIWKRMQS
jgi:type III pantothenate kinase